MPSPELHEFAALLMKHVRDEAIASCDMSRNPDCDAISAKRWRKIQQYNKIDDVLADIVPDCIDRAIFYLLHAVDEGLLKLLFKTSSGHVVDLVEAGESEMAGWVAMGGSEGWRARFSKERVSED